MASIRLITGLCLVAISMLLCRSQSLVNSSREDLIQDSVRRLLGVKSGTERTAPSGKLQSLPYIMDLYEKYRSGQTPMQGNTVRSILSIRDTIGEVDMLIFNLTGISSSEQILQSKLYLLKRRKPKPGKKREASFFRLKIGCLPNMTSHRYIDIALSRQKPEWHSYDISESVVTCKLSKKKEHLLGLILEVKRSKGSHRLSSFKRLVKQNSQPFLLIFSEDNQNQTHSVPKASVYDEIGKLLRAKADEEGTVPETTRSSVKRKKRSPYFRNPKANFLLTDRLKNQFLTANYHSDHFPENSELNVSEKTLSYTSNFKSDVMPALKSVLNKLRYMLSVNTLNTVAFQNNHATNDRRINHQVSHINHATTTDYEVPSKVLFLKSEIAHERLQEPIGITQNVSVDHAVEAVPAEPLRIKRSISSAMHYSTMSKEMGSHDMDPTINTIQVLDVHKSDSETILKPRQRNRHRTSSRSSRKHRKKKRRRYRKLPFWWTKHDNRFHSQDASKLCKRKSLIVDFSQMGWDDWIISPKSFNAHYCAGGCTFPLIKDAKPSNHAAIQSLVYAIGLNPNVPTPCCVPSVTSSLTLLYFDENGSLVLKNYPNMIVEKCACR